MSQVSTSLVGLYAMHTPAGVGLVCAFRFGLLGEFSLLIGTHEGLDYVINGM